MPDELLLHNHLQSAADTGTLKGPTNKPLVTAEQVESSRLRAGLEPVTMKRDILGKHSAYFATRNYTKGKGSLLRKDLVFMPSGLQEGQIGIGIGPCYEEPSIFLARLFALLLKRQQAGQSKVSD